MEREFVCFRTIKQAVSLEETLAHYGVRLRRVGGASLRGHCPLPSHSSKVSNQSLAVDTARRVWACHSASCIAARGGRLGGSVIDFVAAMNGCSILEAALRLQERFLSSPHTVIVAADRVTTTGTHQQKRITSVGDLVLPLPNEPLTFMLMKVDSSHPYLADRRIREETAACFGIGFYRGRGLMSGRIVIPIHEEYGNLIAYAGRAIDGSLPKYKLPPNFKKSAVLFNLHRARASREERVVLVEGFFDCVVVHQAGFLSVVALMGTWLSTVQAALLAASFSEVVFML